MILIIASKISSAREKTSEALREFAPNLESDNLEYFTKNVTVVASLTATHHNGEKTSSQDKKGDTSAPAKNVLRHDLSATSEHDNPIKTFVNTHRNPVTLINTHETI